MSEYSDRRPLVRVFVQARMTSVRFPGKVLAPFAGRPLIAHVLDRVREVLPPHRIVVATSTDPTDDPLACYVADRGIAVHRGSLHDVFGRFRTCLQEHPCAWFCRLCADSPLLDGSILGRMLPCAHRLDLDLVTNVQKRTFPKGHSVELVRSDRFAALDADRLTADENEHVTRYYYNHAAEFRILNVESGDADLGRQSFVVDTLEDHQRLQGLVRDGCA
jgi:spore coat polysaccharide biosynthesis protein SpsF